MTTIKPSDDSAALTRTPGQTSMLPGTVRVDRTIYTSGLVDPAVLTGDSVPEVADQARAALAALLRAVEEAGGSRDTVVKVDAILAEGDYVSAWNDAWNEIWPEPGPARITFVAGFPSPKIAIEVQAIAMTA